MEWKVRALDTEGNPIEPKKEEQTQEESVQETAQETIEEPKKEEIKEEIKKDDIPQEEVKQEQNSSEEKQEKQEKQEGVLEKPFELDDKSILNYLKDRHNLEVESIDVLKNTDKKQEQSLPEDIAKFMEYKDETGRSFDDYAKLQQDWSKVDETTRLREYYKQTKPHLDIDEIDYLITEEYSYDADIDDEKDVKKKKIAYKEELYKATSHFEGLKEKYKAPLESRGTEIPENYKEALNFYDQYREQSEKDTKAQGERSRIFMEKTNNLFSDEFKGFEFNVGEKKQAFKPTDVIKVKEVQSDINNFFNQHLDQDGKVKDINAYHKALYAAQNSDSLAKYFYEQGRADATDGLVKETKNIDMSVRENVQSESSGTKFRAVSSDDEFSFKIKKR
jgi:hypothetical protein